MPARRSPKNRTPRPPRSGRSKGTKVKAAGPNVRGQSGGRFPFPFRKK